MKKDVKKRTRKGKDDSRKGGKVAGDLAPIREEVKKENEVNGVANNDGSVSPGNADQMETQELVESAQDQTVLNETKHEEVTKDDGVKSTKEEIEKPGKPVDPREEASPADPAPTAPVEFNGKIPEIPPVSSRLNFTSIL